MLDLQTTVKDEAIIHCICQLGAIHLDRVEVTLEEVEEAYNKGHQELKEAIDYILFDEAE